MNRATPEDVRAYVVSVVALLRAGHPSDAEWMAGRLVTFLGVDPAEIDREERLIRKRDRERNRERVLSPS